MCTSQGPLRVAGNRQKLEEAGRALRWGLQREQALPTAPFQTSTL